jgi:hypothetical protein
MFQSLQVTDLLRDTSKILVDKMENCNYKVITQFVLEDDTVFGMEDGKCKFIFKFNHFIHGERNYQINQIGDIKSLDEEDHGITY